MQRTKSLTRVAVGTLSAVGIALLTMTAARADGDDRPFLPHFVTSSTIPANGDLNPYGVAFVPKGFPTGGAIAPGDVLVANFNNSGNAQGEGTTIITLTPNGAAAPQVPVGQPGNATTFFQGAALPGLPGLGLSNALGVLRRGFVLVGAVPTTDGKNVQPPGALLFLDRNGNEIAPSPFTNQLDGPWDLTIDDDFDHAQVFVANVLNGTVTRLNLNVSDTNITVTSAAVIASGYAFRTDPAAIVLGPTGLAYDEEHDLLYVASTADNAIFVVPHAGHRTGSAGTGAVVTQGGNLRGPLALAFAPNGDLLTANGDAVNGDPTHPSEILEFTRGGRFVREFNVDAGQDGAFGLATVLAEHGGFNFAYDNDNNNTVSVTARPRDEDASDFDRD